MNINSDYTFISLGSDNSLNINRDGEPAQMPAEGDIITGVITQNGQARTGACIPVSNDANLVKLARDFSDTMDSLEAKENEGINKGDDDDLAKLRNEGFTIEDFTAERLAHAIERVQEGRSQKEEDIAAQVDALRETSRDIKTRSVRNAADKYDAQCRIADRLFSTSDTVIDDNYTDTVLKGASAVQGNRAPVMPRFKATSVPVTDIAIDENASAPIAVIGENTSAPIAVPIEEQTAPQTVISTEEPAPASYNDLVFRLHLEEIRLSMSVSSGKATADISIIEADIMLLKDSLSDYYGKLNDEMNIDDALAVLKPGETVELAVQTSLAVTDIGNAPVSFYREAISKGGQKLTLEALQTMAVSETIDVEGASLTDTPETESRRVQSSRVSVMHVLDAYEASSTEIRRDLGDSIGKAFDTIDECLEANNLDLTDANRRAVKIIAGSGMELTKENIETVKFFDDSVTSVVEGLKPAVVLSLIRSGINPLETSLESLDELIRERNEEPEVQKEVKFSTFLVNLEAHNGITEEEREAYIGIYRLLHDIARDNYSAIGAVLEAGEEVNFKNLLRARRSFAAAGIDAAIDDTTDVVRTSFVNSISDQIAAGFRYNRRLTDEILSYDDPDVIDEALSDTVPDREYENLTLEEVAEKLKTADKEHTESIPVTAAAIKYLMSFSPEYRRFLKSLGVKDSFRNVSSLIEGIEEDSLFIGISDTDELIEAMGSRDELTAFAQKAADKALKATATDTARTIRGDTAGLLSELDRYSLLKQFTSKEHYRFTLGTATPASVTLTMVHDETKVGSIDIEISTEALNLTASLSAGNADSGVEAHTVLYGSLSCEDTSQIPTVSSLLSEFIAAVGKDGIDATGITVRTRNYGVMQRLDRIKKLKQGETGTHTDNSVLYNIATTFLKVMINKEIIR